MSSPGKGLRHLSWCQSLPVVTPGRGLASCRQDVLSLPSLTRAQVPSAELVPRTPLLLLPTFRGPLGHQGALHGGSEWLASQRLASKYNPHTFRGYTCVCLRETGRLSRIPESLYTWTLGKCPAGFKNKLAFIESTLKATSR